ncbi:endolytic transglycosylase MltG [Thiomicrospira sp.]|uniref:endolytic transglycosylase MltG n=1 Tax=Thiomicrospira sp. TaxID=935 RepID=UPI002F929307
MSKSHPSQSKSSATKAQQPSSQVARLSRLLFLTRLGLISLLSLLILLIAGFVWAYHLSHSPIANSAEPQIVELPKGASAKAMARQLHQAGMLKHPEAFVWYLRLNQQANSLKPGEFMIQPEWDFRSLMQALVSGRNVSYPFVIIPGESLAQVKQKLAQLPKLNLVMQTEDWQSLGQKMGVTEHLEGWLLPETYHYHKDETDRELVKRAITAMKQALEAEWSTRDGGLPLKTPYEALTLASIIEKETGVAHERHQVAGVFIRRLQKGMRLQTDPTVIYGMGERYQGHIGREGLDTVTPYNTYRIRGLTPTPIAMPSRESIRAALRPDASDALYFVSKGNGEHYFSSTLEEHNRAVRRYILNKP